MAAFRDMEEVSQGLLSLLGTNRAEAQQRRLLGRHEQVVERLLETQDGAEQRLREILDAEKEVAQGLLDAKEQAQQAGAELQQLEAELQRAGEEDARLKASLLQLTRELEELREIEADLERQERGVDEDTTVTIPSAVYVAQLYHRISKIEWDYECEPGMIKGIHHGPSVAQPLHLDGTQLSKKFVSDYLWSLVDTEW
ncbi:PREDICTED: kinetochore protein Spc24 [Ceratotherium simum simum]|uniref:Kinetochore protein Spc24 n=1 Tax=Ceratotherium simum simum TaxID=73337 RepID=A0ABM0I8N3_CERSS|nr:PREDICTED: kinetochore protein Spc24 [Ceratotherium simum simum]